MRKFRRFTWMIVLLVSLALVTAACGSQTKQAQSNSQTGSSSTNGSGSSTGGSGKSNASASNSGSSSNSGSQASSSSQQVLKIGTLYAKSGSYAQSSMPEYNGLKFWINQVNASGGVYVKAKGKKMKLKLVSYNDQSKPKTARSQYNQLITQDHVDLMVADFGSVLTSVAVPIAKEHKQLLFDQTGTGAKFFTRDNPYIVLTSLPTSGRWPQTLAKYLTKNNYKNIAILYDSNDFDQSQQATLTKMLKNNNITPVYNHAVPSSTSNYSVLIHKIASKNPDAVIEFGYPNNDTAFLQALQSSGQNFKTVFTVFPGQLPNLFIKNLGLKSLDGLYTYPAPPLLQYNDVNTGMGVSKFLGAYKQKTGKDANFLTIAGYNTGLVIQKTLANAKSLKQLDLRHAVNSFSGKMKTLDGNFKIDPKTGAQIGEQLPVAQLRDKSGKLQVNIVQK